MCRDGLTLRQLEVAQRAAAGLSNGQIAQALCISRHTVHRHLVAIYRRLGLRSRAELAAYALARGWVDAEAILAQLGERRREGHEHV